MLTSFFSKSKPINTIVVLVYMTIGFIVASINTFNQGFTGAQILGVIGLWLIYIFTMFVLNFISQKNSFTYHTSYRMLLFAGFTLAFPEALINPRIIISGLFIMLSMRRILSLRSDLYMELKLFDASLWIGLATFVFFWSHIFVFVLLVALFFYGMNSWRYWFIPSLAVAAIAILGTCYVLFINEDSSYILSLIDDASFSFRQYSTIRIMLPIAFVSAFFLGTIWAFLKEYTTASTSLRPTYVLILVFALVALLVVLVAPDKDGQEWYFFAIPLAIMATSFFESTSNKWISEVLLWIIVLLPFVNYFL